MLIGDAFILAGFVTFFVWLGPHVRIISPPSHTIQFLLAIVIGDFLGYWHHRLMHRIPWLWASHSVHHQSRAIELSTGLRNHPFATISSGLFWSPLLLLGISPAIMLAAVSAIGTWVILIHRQDSKRYPRVPKPLNYLLNLPGHHRSHHQRKLSAGNCNYGLLFIAWDRLFGTYSPPVSIPIAYGIDDAPATGKVSTLLWYEWRRLICIKVSPLGATPPITFNSGLLAYGAAVLLLAAVGTTFSIMRG